ncbi:hypothetical protein TVAG_079720 [Trichomonas vaginalis G3]|uniref:MI domain-containing protein n=1 Tax=Trichomonas vaginalis (strain ATCC PRA-98 / G3) TaxID=412133 RepID=A2EFA2_TRIV3|nr:hypothetical protein TVAGG3_1030620 [Trichomonas vaginalis G3]EAY08712.1 hypothetical protein TVAG_079720 [Trichomonas vaginalis G3]KAI5492839.1 hypothetical protein TVAGG3_1030620 [Trichomonas vaginalis G3]|eukprot:XP_001320935.1 hypothetical protein [Trichomonas vaginalis G3]
MQRPGDPHFMGILLNSIDCDEIETMTSLMEALRIPLMAKIEVNEIVFSIILERKMAEDAFRFYMFILCDMDCKLSAIRFFEACVSNDILVKDALDAIYKSDFKSLVCISLYCEFEVKRSLITIISRYIEFHKFDAAETAVQIGILKAIKSFIPDHIQLVLDSLNAIIGKYYEENQGAIIYGLIDENKIIEKLDEALEDLDNDEDPKTDEVFENLTDFLEALNQLVE